MSAAVETSPDRRAIVFGETSITYRELDERSSRLARYLIDRGARPEQFIGIGISRSLDSVVAVWAIAKTGAAFVPLDPNYPADRIANMVSDADIRIGLATRSSIDALPSEVDWLVIDDPDIERTLAAYSAEPIAAEDRNGRLRPESPAYVIYTSGSTGRPKGVVVTHTGLAGFSAEQRERYDVTADSNILHVASPSFDASVLEYLLAIGSGATLVVVPPGIYGGEELEEIVQRESVTHAFITPSALASLDPAKVDSFEALSVGGEAVPAELVTRWAGTDPAGKRRFFNGYGPTETTIMTNISHALAPGETMTIGGPIRGMSNYVLDERLQPVPTGVAGELYLAGPGLARGYHRRPGLTAERFVASPFTPGDRLYRTGDVVRWRESGDIEYLGRNDFQVKLRGFRIELGEIDAVLNSHPQVNFAVTIGKKTPSGATVLVAYVRTDSPLDNEILTTYAAGKLPVHMVPSVIVPITEIPLTPVGKLDRNALPEPIFESAEFRPPETPLEEIVAATFAEVLSIDQVGRDDDFFDLGGNSLIATQVAARLAVALDATVPARLVFESSVVSQLAAAVESLQGKGARPALAPRPRPDHIPLSFAQRRMWFLSRFDPESPDNNVPLALRFRGHLDTAALQAAVGDVIARHEILRTFYPEFEGTGYQQVLPVGESVPDLTPVHVSESEVVEWFARFALRGFDVTAAPPVRAALLQLGDDDFVLAFVAHHICVDGTSQAPFARDLITAYLARAAGTAPVWKPLEVQYADYALWQFDVLGDESDPASIAAQQIAYWRERLAGTPEKLELPTTFRRPAVRSSRGSVVEFSIDQALVARLDEIGRAAEASLFMVFHAAFAVLLGRLASTDDVTIGSPIAGRGDAALDDLVGMFVNTLVLRTEFGLDTPFDELLRSVRKNDIDAFSNAEIPFERLVEVLDPVRSTAHHPLFQVALFFQNMAAASGHLPGLEVETVGMDGAIAKFDLQLTVMVPPGDVDSDVEASFIYAADLFDEATIRGLVDQFTSVLAAVANDPARAVGDIALLDAPARAQILAARNQTSHPVSESLILDGFDARVAAAPDATALVYEGSRLTYVELDARVNQLARFLIAEGVGPESLVGLAIRRSVDLVVGMYAIVRAGGAWVPIDPDHPAERIGHILSTANPVCVLTTERDQFSVAAADFQHVPLHHIDTIDLTPFDGASRPNVAVHPDNPAYVIFTSGSTGRPKGVAVSHRAIVNQLVWMHAEYGIDSNDVYLQKTATTFDVSLWGYFLPLRAGATMVIASPLGHRDPLYLADRIAENGVTVTDFVPSMFTVFAEQADAEKIATLRTCFLIGEALPPETVAAFEKVSSATVENLYGPTEAAVSITYQTATSTTPTVPIGVPEWNSQAYVLDSRLHPVPDGVVGELYLAGTQLARGYVARPDLTSDRFVADPYGPVGTRMYRTGDLVRWTGDVLDYIGRVDFQVKFRGQRIELGEIETALLAQDGVSQAVVVVRSDAHGEQLTGYVVAGRDVDLDVSVVRSKLSDWLPSYMIPSAVVLLDEFPLNASGKLDRKALPAPEAERREFRAPETESQQRIAHAFSTVLGVPQVGLDDDFFALGGHSLLVIKVLREIGSVGVRPLTIQSIFEYPRVEDLAAWVDSEHTEADPHAAITRHAALPDDITPDGTAPVRPVGRILLTGATGFLGSHILRELLARTDAEVWCLVRANSPEAARVRLSDAVQRFGPPLDPAAEHRVHTVVGDLGRPRLGLSDADWDLLARDADLIIHNGARVNHAEPYDRLHEPNVVSTQDILRLAVADHLKPVHFVSTASVVRPSDVGPGKPFTIPETEWLSFDRVAPMGYVQSKWVAEANLRSAAERGIPVSVYRPGLIGGDLVTGATGTEDAFWNVVRAAVSLGVIPDTAVGEVALVPVNFVAAAIAAIATDAEQGNGVYHLVARRKARLADLRTVLENRGFPLRDGTIAEFAGALMAAMENRTDTDDDDPLVRAVLVGSGFADGFNDNAVYGMDNTDAALRETGIVCPDVDVEAFGRYVDFFIASGFFAR